MESIPQKIAIEEMGRKDKVDKDDDDEVEEVTRSGGSKSKGLNWSAIGIMLMFGIPVVLAGIIQVCELYS